MHYLQVTKSNDLSNERSLKTIVFVWYVLIISNRANITIQNLHKITPFNCAFFTKYSDIKIVLKSVQYKHSIIVCL